MDIHVIIFEDGEANFGIYPLCEKFHGEREDLPSLFQHCEVQTLRQELNRMHEYKCCTCITVEPDACFRSVIWKFYISCQVAKSL